MNQKKLIGMVAGILGIGIAIAVICALIAANTGKKQNQDEETSSEAVELTETQTEESGENVTKDASGQTETSGQSADWETTESETVTETTESDNERKTGGEITVVNGLTEMATEYEGRVGTGDYNYGEALQKSILFYELQRSGDLSLGTVRTNWRGNCGMDDGSDVGLDLTGGLNDAGDNMKFNLPMSYTGSVLAWSIYEYGSAYEESGQLEYLEETIRWINDYLMKCHPESDVYYYQVGDGSVDHSFWGPCEVVTIQRNSYKVDADNPGSTPAGEAAASLASAAVVFKDTDADYAAKCLTHAEQLFDFAYRTKSNTGYTQSNGFYSDNSGYWDELAWSACWLYLATGDKDYLTKAEECIDSKEFDPKWTLCWDDNSLGVLTLLCELTGDKTYASELEENLAYWTTGMADGSRVTYTPKGLAWLDSWGALRYATTEAFVALVYSKCDTCSAANAKTYQEFAESQINYALGSSGMSYVIGFGDNYPEHVHHRTAHGSYTNNINDPEETRHTLYGALVGGPDSNDTFSDNRNEYIYTEVGCDYNAGFTGALAALYEVYGGQTLVGFGAVETVTEDEFFVEAGVNVDGENFTEIKAYVYNESAWPARVTEHLEMRYFLDLSEVYEAGGSVADITVTSNYMQGGTVGEPVAWDEENHIYYVPVSFEGVAIYPGGQENYRKEVQVRIASGTDAAKGVWDDSNDPSYAGLGSTGSVAKTANICLYDGGELVWGTEP